MKIPKTIANMQVRAYYCKNHEYAARSVGIPRMVDQCTVSLTNKGRAGPCDIVFLIEEPTALVKAAENFIEKVDTGKARSVDSYLKFKMALGLVGLKVEEGP